MGLDAWFPPPDDSALPEVQRGFIAAGLRRELEKDHDLPPATCKRHRSAWSWALRFVGNPSPCAACIPRSRLSPSRSRLRRRSRLRSKASGLRCRPAHNLVIFPAEKRFTVVYCAKTKNLRRVFIPGIHKSIPLAARINRDAAIRYQSPPTIRDRLLAAAALRRGKRAVTSIHFERTEALAMSSKRPQTRTQRKSFLIRKRQALPSTSCWQLRPDRRGPRVT